MKKIKRIYSHYEEWEDYQSGMYEELKKNESVERIHEAILLLSNPMFLYGAMMNVIRKWKIASDFNLSNRSYNRRAWLGQASCNLAIGAKDSEVKKAWWTISVEERRKANLVADAVIKEYEKIYWREINEEKIRD